MCKSCLRAAPPALQSRDHRALERPRLDAELKQSPNDTDQLHRGQTAVMATNTSRVTSSRVCAPWRKSSTTSKHRRNDNNDLARQGKGQQQAPKLQKTWPLHTRMCSVSRSVCEVLRFAAHVWSVDGKRKKKKKKKKKKQVFVVFLVLCLSLT